MNVMNSFGELWTDYLRFVGDAQRKRARTDLESWFGDGFFSGKRVLDLGAGSGLQSLAALDAGAASAVSVDADAAPATALREQQGGERAADWSVVEGSVEDEGLMSKQEQADVILFWGTPSYCDWKRAMELLAPLAAPGAFLLFAMPYATEPVFKELEAPRKKFQTASAGGRGMMYKRAVLKRKWELIRKGKSAHEWQYTKERGSSVMHDLWLSFLGWPFHTASVDEVNREARKAGWVLEDLRVAGEGFPNEYLFRMPEVGS